MTALNDKTTVNISLPQAILLIGMVISATTTIVLHLRQTNERLTAIESKLENRYVTRLQLELYLNEVRNVNRDKFPTLTFPEVQPFLTKHHD